MAPSRLNENASSEVIELGNSLLSERADDANMKKNNGVAAAGVNMVTHHTLHQSKASSHSP